MQIISRFAQLLGEFIADWDFDGDVFLLHEHDLAYKLFFYCTNTIWHISSCRAHGWTKYECIFWMIWPVAQLYIPIYEHCRSIMIDYNQTLDMTIHYLLTDFSFCQQFTRNTIESVKNQILVMMFFYCTNTIFHIKCTEKMRPITEAAVQKACLGMDP